MLYCSTFVCLVLCLEHPGHSHVMFCALEKQNDGYSIKPIKQKQCVDGLLYILQEFYGIENKESDQSKVPSFSVPYLCPVHSPNSMRHHTYRVLRYIASFYLESVIFSRNIILFVVLKPKQYPRGFSNVGLPRAL